MSTKVAARGWAKPAASRKWHYFLSASTRSLCNRWFLRGVDLQESSFCAVADECKDCREAVARLCENAAQLEGRPAKGGAA